MSDIERLNTIIDRERRIHKNAYKALEEELEIMKMSLATMDAVYDEQLKRVRYLEKLRTCRVCGTT